MLYECSCSFTAETATAFYKHLANSKDDDDLVTHQLVQAKFTEGSKAAAKGGKNKVVPSGPSGGQKLRGSKIPTGPAAPDGIGNQGKTWDNIGSWVKEYLSPEAAEIHAAAVAARAGAATPDVDASAELSLSSSSIGANALCGSQADQAAVALASEVRHRRTVSAAATSSSTASAAVASTVITLESDSSGEDIVRTASEHEPVLPISTRATVTKRSTVTATTSIVSVSTYSLPPSVLQAGSSLLGMVAQGMNPLKLFGLIAFDKNSSRDVQQGSAGQRITFENSWGVVVPAVEDVLLWKQPWHSAKVFGMGLYVLLCYTQLYRGSSYLQPSTAMLFLAFLLLLVNTIQGAISTAKEEAAAEGEPAESRRETSESVPATGLHSSDTKLVYLEREQAVFNQVTVGLNAVGAIIVPYTAATVALCYRALSGRRLVTSAMVAVALWGGMVLGELRLVSQTLFCALGYIAVFSLPACYIRSRTSMDSVVEELLRFVARAVVNCDRSSALMAVAAFLVISVLAPLNIVLRMSLAVVAGFSMLLWKFPSRPQVEHEKVS